jgi:hypothetical protein
VDVHKQVARWRGNALLIVVKGVGHVNVNDVVGGGFGGQPIGHTGGIIFEIILIGIVIVKAGEQNKERERQ